MIVVRTLLNVQRFGMAVLSDSGPAVLLSTHRINVHIIVA